MIEGLDHFDAGVEPRKVDPETFAREAYRAYRKANRPFRRAFPGGERRRKILLAVGRHTAASKEAQS